MLKPEIKELWVKALTSGEYGQADKVLHTPDHKFCCLGVLCDLYRKETGAGEWKEGTVGIHHGDKMNIVPILSFVVGDEVASRREPFLMYAWACDESNVGVASRDFGTLAMMNDQGKTFREIAEFITEKL